MDSSNNTDMEKVNSLPRDIRVKIASKIEQRINTEVGEYNLSKNSEYRRVCQEVAEEYGITRNEAACLYLGWDAYKKLNKEK